MKQPSSLNPVEHLRLTREQRALSKGQLGHCVWLVGLSGAGKSTIAKTLEWQLHGKNHHTYVLDGDNLRNGLNIDLGFSVDDRTENIRRLAEVANLMVDAGLIVVVAAISPINADRQNARRIVGASDFLEVFVDAPLATCESRDVKGMYAKARRGEIKNFTGVSSVFEPPLSPDLRLDTTTQTPDEAVGRIVDALELRGIFAR